MFVQSIQLSSAKLTKLDKKRKNTSFTGESPMQLAALDKKRKAVSLEALDKKRK